MRLGEINFQIAAEISNGFDTLIPIATLLYYDVPTSDYAFQGIHIEGSSWSYFDAEFLHHVYGSKLHQSLKALVFLIRHRFFSASYKVIQVADQRARNGKQMTFWKVRVYAVPSDIDGSRHVKSWRLNWSSNYSNLHKRTKACWKELLPYLNFCPNRWFNDITPKKDETNAGFDICVAFYAKTHTRLPKDERQNYYHIDRWLNSKGFGVETPPFESLDDLVRTVYGDISTPEVSKHTQKAVREAYGVPTTEEILSMLALKIDSGSEPVTGLMTALYPFQLRSVYKMYEKESIPSRQSVPHFVEIRSPIGTTYFYNTLNNEFYLRSELYSVPKGGILAENMGLGKTLICLALVCLTKHEVSTIPSELLLEPSPEFVRSSTCPPLKSLFEIALVTIAQNSLPWKYYSSDIPPAILGKLECSPGEFFISSQPNHGLSGSRVRKASGASMSQIRKLFLTSSTLVIVPENLLHQWNDEAKKHVDSSFLRRLFLSERFKSRMTFANADYASNTSSDPLDLLCYDLVVISIPLFSKLSTNPHNVFMKLYWKRLIIDEGHSMSSRTSNLSISCKQMYAERRWVVTGTPTSGLTNLHMEEDISATGPQSPQRKKRKYTVKGNFNVREDLAKLGSLVSNYFNIEPFHSQPGIWGSSITKNLTNEYQLIAKMSLQKLLNSLMVRHNQVQVEKDLVLPQLHHEAVFLEPSFQNKLAINLFTSVLAVNAVSSERVGSDYMFDSSNRQQLQKLVSNLQLSTFYWTGFQISDVTSLMNVLKHCLEKTQPNGQPYYEAEDVRLLHNSLAAIKTALRNPRWRAASSLHEMQLYVAGLPEVYTANFAIGAIDDVGVYGASQLHAVQKSFYKNRFSSMVNSQDWESRLKSESEIFWREYWARSEKKEKGKLSNPEAYPYFDTQSKKKDSEKSEYFPVRQFCPLLELGDKEVEFNRGHGSCDSSAGTEQPQSPSALERAQIIGTASSKLSYLASKLVGHQKDGIKSIVFFEYEDSAYYLTELLDVLGVKYILYATFIGAERRPNNLNNFASHDSDTLGGVTLIMDLKLASHGLTVISATRVYFMSPVWQRSVEAQAIKRAHRIGQTQDVYVETLLLRGTLEEEIYRRRIDGRSSLEDKGVTDDDEPRKKNVIDDTGMQNYVMRHEFLSINDSEPEYAEFTEKMESNAMEAKQLSSVEERTNGFDFSLQSHSARTCKSKDFTIREWNMRLFSEDNLQKLGESKQVKPDLTQLNSDFVAGRAQSCKKPKSSASVRKSVKF